MKYFIGISSLLALSLIGMTVHGDIIVDRAISRDAVDQDGVSRPVREAMIAERSDMGILRFSTGDSLRGELLSLDPARGVLLWKSPETSQEILFKTDKVVSVEIGNHIVDHNRKVIIELTNGDSLPCNMLALDLSDARLETRYGGILTVKRHMIKRIYPANSTPDILFSGSGSIEDWRVESRSGGVATFDDGIININGACSIGRDMNIGDMVRIDFHFEVTGNFQFQIMIFSGEQARSTNNCYWLSMSTGYAYLQRYGPRGSENLGNVQLDELRTGKGKLTLLADRKNGKFTLLIDDVISKQWTDAARIEGAGSHVHFSNQTHGTLKIRDLKVSVWNGKFSEDSNVAEAVEEDQIMFVNGDQIRGSLQTIANNTVTIKTEYFEISVPLERIKHIQTASSGRHLARRNAGDVRLFFPDGHSLTLDLSGISDGNVIGKSENLGDAQLALNAFISFDMNIYRDRKD